VLLGLEEVHIFWDPPARGSRADPDAPCQYALTGSTALEVQCVVDGWMGQCEIVDVFSGKMGYEVAGYWVLRDRIEGSRQCWGR